MYAEGKKLEWLTGSVCIGNFFNIPLVSLPICKQGRSVDGTVREQGKKQQEGEGREAILEKKRTNLENFRKQKNILTLP